MPETPLTCAYSTCPNDTFAFGAMAGDSDLQIELHDVETLNQLAFKEQFDITKLSFHAWLLVQDHYQRLNVGAALGRGCGPLLITKAASSNASLPDTATIAIPGELTTAHLLLRLWNPGLKNRIFMPFDQIMNAVESGKADAGVIIHEGRFVYESQGFHKIVDLGDWWENETGHPIPLGCIAAHKRIGQERIAAFEKRLRSSIETAFADPDSVRDYVKQHAQELDDDVIENHIKTYINAFTLDLGPEGRAAIDHLQSMAQKAGIL